MIYKKLRGGSTQPPKNLTGSQEPQKSFFKKIGNGITDSFRIFKKDFGNTASKFKKHIGNKASEFKTHFGEKASKLKTHINNKVSNLKTRIGNKAHTISLKAQVFSKKASLKLSEGIAQAKKIKYIIPGRDPINRTNIELKKQELKNLTHELEIIAEQKKNKKDSSKKAINAIAQVKKDSNKIKNIMAPHSKILGLNIRKINEYNQIKKILNKKLNNNKIHTKIDNHTKLEDTHKKKLQKLFHKMTRKYVPQASITKSILSLGISPLLNVYERRKRATELINLDKSTETGQKDIINKIKQLHVTAQNTSLVKHENQFNILKKNITSHEQMKTNIETIKQTISNIHENYSKITGPTDSDKNAYKIALNIQKDLLNKNITNYIKEKEKARQEYKIKTNKPLYMLSNDTQKRLKTIEQKLLTIKDEQNEEFKSISTPSIMNKARKQSIEKQIQQKLQKAIPPVTGYISIDNINIGKNTTKLGLSQNPNKNARLTANPLKQVPNILSESEKQAQALNARLNALETKFLNYNTTTAISMPEENEYFPLEKLPSKKNEVLYALLPNNLSIPNSNSSTLLKKKFNKVLQELQTNINTKRKARIIELQEKFKQTPLPSKNNTNN